MSPVGQRPTRWASALLTCTVGLLVLAGCGGAPVHEDGPQASGVNRTAMDAVLAHEPTQLVKDALADHWVSDAEYAAARDELRDCLVAKHPDVTVTFASKGGYTMGPVPQDRDAADRLDKDVAGCERSVSALESLYFDTRSNPEGLTWPEGVRRCVGQHEVSAGLELSDEEFAALVQVHDDGSYFDPGSTAGRACELDPFDPQSQLDRAADATFDWRK